MGETCPECGNDVYAPYNYCSSCGWEASGKDKKRAEEKREKELEKKKRMEEAVLKKRRARERKKREAEEGKKRKHHGRKPVPDPDEDDEEDEDDDDWDDEEDKDRADTRYRADYASGVRYRHDPSARYHSYDKGDYRSDGPVEYAPGPDYQPTPPTRIPCRCGADIIVRTTKRPVRVQCKECGARAIIKGPKKKPGGRGGGPPPRDRKRPPSRPKPTKGKCNTCGSQDLKFFDNGSGECPDCNRRFWWDKEAEAKKPDPWKDKGARGEYFCKSCDNPLTFVKMYEKWYCEYCRRYM